MAMRPLALGVMLLPAAAQGETTTAPTLAKPTTTFHPPAMGNCSNPDFGPVLAGVDFVDVQEVKAKQSAAPDFGSEKFTAKLNGYTFWFKTAENQAKFNADPWKYAPGFGGFWGYAMWMASVDTSIGDCHIGVDILSGGYYTETADYGLPPYTVMQRGSFPEKRFNQAMPKSGRIGLQNWKKCYGTDRSKWPFNTRCCAKGNTKAGTSGDQVCSRPEASVVV